MEGLGRKAVSGIFWSGGTKVISQTFSWLSTLAVARILSPGDYGTMAIAGIFAGVMAYLAEFGVGSALIQKKELTAEETDGLFWFVVFNSVVLALLLVAAAPFLAGFFKTPALTPVLRVVSINFVLYGFCSIQNALLAKDLNFEARSKVDIAVDLFGVALLIGCAWAGLGVWSLVYSYIGKSFLSAILLNRLTRYRPSLRFSFRRTSSLIRFGMHVVGGRLFYYVFAQADCAVVGKFLGANVLGSYSMAMQVASAPLEKVIAILSNIQYATFAKLQDDRERLRQFFLAFTRVMAAVCFPMLAGLIWIAPDFIDTVLTGKWRDAVLPLQMLAAMSLFKCLAHVVSPMLMSIGKPQLPMRFNFIFFCALPPSFAVGAYAGGVKGVALAWLLVYCPIALYSVWVGLKEIGLGVGEYYLNLHPIVVSTALMMASLFLFNLGAAGLLHGWLKLPAEIAVGGGIYAAVLFGCFPALRRDVTYVLGRNSAPVPDAVCTAAAE